MKRIFTLLAITLILTSCRKDTYYQPIDEGQWLNQERAVVVYSDNFCDYYVVQTYSGYAVLRSWGTTPYRGSVMYGNFSSWGVGTFYNRTEGYLARADVRENRLSYWAAMDELDWYCDTQ